MGCRVTGQMILTNWRSGSQRLRGERALFLNGAFVVVRQAPSTSVRAERADWTRGEGGSETRHYRVRRQRDCPSRGSGRVSIFFHQGDLCETPSVERRTPSQSPSPADWGRGRRVAAHHRTGSCAEIAKPGLRPATTGCGGDGIALRRRQGGATGRMDHRAACIRQALLPCGGAGHGTTELAPYRLSSIW